MQKQKKNLQLQLVRKCVTKIVLHFKILCKCLTSKKTAIAKANEGMQPSCYQTSKSW